jgi:hypothetical protein
LQQLRGDGQGGLAMGPFEEIIPAGGHPVDVWTGDLDGDRLTDALVLWYSGSSVPFVMEAYRGLGDGRFASPQAWSPPLAVKYAPPLVGDFDADGKDEVAFVLSDLRAVVRLELDAAEGWRIAGEKRIDSLSGFMPVVDWNEDGFDDLAVLQEVGDHSRFTVLLGYHERALEWISRQRVPYRVTELGSLDGRLIALEYTRALFGDLKSLRALGPGNEMPEVVWSIDVPERTWAADLSLDLDGDGLRDLRLLRAQDAHVYWGEPIGPPSRGPTLVATEWLIASLDLDGDGLPDLITEEGSAVWQVATREFEENLFVTTVFEGFVDQPHTHVEAGDLNGDGLEDLVAQTFYADTFSSLVSRGDGTFEVSRLDADPRDILRPHLVDLDRDGHLDLVASHRGRSVGWGRGDGTFELHLEPRERTTRLVGELGGDGDRDLVELHEASGVGEPVVLRTLLGRDRTFAPSGYTSEYAKGLYTGDPTLADLDGDGLDDLVQVQETERGGSLVWRRSLGDGALAEPAPIFEGLEAVCSGASVRPVDFDRDGTMDLFYQPGGSVCRDLDYMSLRGLGGGRYELIWQGPPTNEAFGITDRLEDVDGDGRHDLVSGQYSPTYLPRYHVEIRRGDGVGGFLPKEPTRWLGPTGKVGVFRETGTRDLVELQATWFGFGKMRVELLPSEGYVLPADAAPPTVELKLVPAGGDVWRPAFLPLDECDSTPDRGESFIALPELGEGFLLSHQSAEVREVLTFESADGARRGVLLRGPERGEMLALFHELRARGGFTVTHMDPVLLVLRPEAPAPAASALPGARPIQRVRLEGGRAVEAEAYGPDADLRFVMEAQDRAGRVGRSTASFREARPR